ncbi:hypothetical protein [Cellulosimicrobium marinum]|uniref:hypothetical protein n=1 Tax=Cellulosimicrobium marinum TaxID=1638992 RepID=UPI001E32991D|nr:hypothetical protein [Cellulosimicrobium marinum]MCB7137050.1 hypothetical protein [Cellulosimicrobium marinum]
MSEIDAYIIAWTGREAAARAIAAALEPAVRSVTVVYSNQDGEPWDGPGEWVEVPDEWFYGPKFAATLRLHGQRDPGAVMLQVQADATCEDWPGLAARCAAVFATRDAVAVWAPDVSFTPLPLRLTGLADAGPDLHHVALVDGIVWALSPDTVERLARHDYRANNVGWGIDWAAACFARSTGKEVLVDASLHVSHPPSRGYRTDDAEAQMERFLDQLDDAEQAARALLRGYLAPRRSSRPVRDGVRDALRHQVHLARARWQDARTGSREAERRVVPGTVPGPG